MKENYSLQLERLLHDTEKTGARPTLLLQVCCAPCSSYVLEYLSLHMDITLFFYNPNIAPASEFTCRLAELQRFTAEAGYENMPIETPPYDASEFYNLVCGMESLSEGGERCRICYELRLRKTAEAAKRGGYDYFCTTLSISPHKNAQWLNEIGHELETEYGVKWLVSDFKKKNGYKRSIELSAAYNLYRQDWCGCAYSKAESEKRRAERDKQA